MGLHWIHWATFVPGFVALEWGPPSAAVPSPQRRNFRLGWLLGIAGVGTLFSWLVDTIVQFSNIPLPLALAILALFSVVFALPYGVLAMLAPLLRRRFGNAWIVLFPATWVAAECLQPALFPYYQGVGQYRVPTTWQLASVFGATSLSFLVLLTNCALTALVLAWRERQPLPWRWAGGVAAAFLANLAFGAWRFEAVEASLAQARTMRAAVVQGDHSMLRRLEERESLLPAWTALTERTLPGDPDLVVWPEGAISGNPTSRSLSSRLGALTQEGGFALLVGGGTAEADPLDARRRIHWNSAYLVEESGKIGGRYDKMVPLPFGEYLPWPVSYLRPYIQGVGDFRAGTEATRFVIPHTSGGISFSTPICYEAILERQMRRLADVDLFVNITNDFWFGDTAAPHQHAMLAAVHAVEFGRPMLRIAYTGVSMVVEPHGVIHDETRPFVENASVATIRLASFDTPYRTWGRAFPWVVSLVGLGAAFVAWRARVTPASSTT